MKFFQENIGLSQIHPLEITTGKAETKPTEHKQMVLQQEHNQQQLKKEKTA